MDRAKDVYEQLVQREPESDSAQRKLKDVMRKMGLLEPEEVPEAPEPVGPETLKLELPEAPAPKVRPGLEEAATEVTARSRGQEPAEPELDEETQKFIAQSLTDVDLFASYGLTQKAIGLLEAILRRAPTHTPTLEKLLDFVLGAGDDRRTAELAAQLEHIHTLRGDSRSGERFGELRRRFQRAAGLTDDEISAAVAAAMPQPVETLPVEEVQATAAEGGADELPVEIAPVEAAEVPAELLEGNAAAEEAPVVEAPPASEPVAEEMPEIEVIEPAPEGEAMPVAGEPKRLTTEEVDLSAEWASLLEETREPEAAAQVPEAAAPDGARPASPVRTLLRPNLPQKNFLCRNSSLKRRTPRRRLSQPRTKRRWRHLKRSPNRNLRYPRKPRTSKSGALRKRTASAAPQPAEPGIPPDRTPAGRRTHHTSCTRA